MDNTHEHTNALIHETSPYLLQHAHNPVDWHPWNEETLKKAKDENKIMIISIGYAACHWCHVMEHESFEDSIVAKIMNENFLPVKVDREELPNVDDVYMTACQLTNQRGCGWPLNAFALPDGRPFWAGTYFPKDQWMSILNQFTTMKTENYAKLEESANKITLGISQSEDLSHLTPESEFTLDTLTAISNRFIMEMDMEDGGRRGAPKFPMPTNIEYLLEYYHLTKDQNAYRAAITTLDKMATGGIYDQLGGGFSRYSVDGIWLAPHFEKMTYDNSQLVSLYAHGYQLTKKPMYKRIIEETLEYTEREMTSPENAFYASLDADSEGEEGKFYVWSKVEVDSLITDKSEAEIFCNYYDISTNGNWEHKNILRIKDAEATKEKFEINDEQLNAILNKGKKALFEARSKRIRPRLDDKILTSWNALMLKGYLDAYAALGNEDYLNKAKANADFIVNKMLNKDNRLDRNYKHGKANINAFLDDYAAVIQAFISMYEHTFDEKWLEKAKDIADYAILHFYDESTGLFFYTSDLDPALVARKKEIADNVIPASNSMMGHNLQALGTIYDDKDYLDKAHKMMAILANQVGRISQPSFYSNWLRLYKKYVSPPYEVAIMGAENDKLRNDLMTHYLPNVLFMGDNKESELPLLKEKFNPDRSLIYVCQNKVCKFPVDNADAALEQLKK